MTVFSAYKKGLTTTIQNKKLWLVLYGLNIGIALLAALPFSNLIESKLGNSLTINELLNGFSYTVLMDFYYEYVESVWAVLDQSILLLIAFLFLYIFLSGGILKTFLNEDEAFSFQNFWGGCGQFFWRFFRLTFYFLIFHSILLGLFTLLFMVCIKWADPNQLVSEVTLLTTAKFLVPLYLICAIILSLLQDYAKIQIISNNPRMINKSIISALRFVFSQFRKTASLYFLIVLTSIIIIFLYGLLQNLFSNQTGAGILLLFLLGQLFLFARIGLKLWNFAGASKLFKTLTSS